MELFSPGHLVVILIVALVLFFGWKQLPDMSRSLGRSLRIFKTEMKGMTEDDDARREAAAQGQVAPPALAPPVPPAAPVVPPAPSNGIPANGAQPSVPPFQQPVPQAPLPQPQNTPQT